ncbi:hypothetical protein [Actinoplanes sp. HUAS TT8]|uniref:hypothetical protein n=1 Tax=Actinoplanes sp. HUAS TT8 TaxID=3447453 RepID=UPI003F525DAC
MAILNTRPVVALLNDFQADPNLTYTALGRHAVLTALASVVGGIAAAEATLADKIYPPMSSRRSAGTDRRWRAAAAHLDTTSRTGGELDGALQTAADLCARVITDLEPVEYNGSLRDQHGDYRIDGSCICENCDNQPLTLQLKPMRPGHVLTCVNLHSISPVPAPHCVARYSVLRVERVLDATLADLPLPLDATDALHLARSLSVITGKARSMAEPWFELIAERLANRRWMFERGGRGHVRTHTRTIIDTCNRVGPALTGMKADLGRAIGVLAAIEAGPEGRRAA